MPRRKKDLGIDWIPEDHDSWIKAKGQLPYLSIKEEQTIKLYTDPNSPTFANKTGSYRKAGHADSPNIYRTAVNFFHRPKIKQAVKIYYAFAKRRMDENNDTIKERLMQKGWNLIAQLEEWKEDETGAQKLHIKHIPDYIKSLEYVGKLSGVMAEKVQVDITVRKALQSVSDEERPILEAAVNERLLQLGQQNQLNEQTETITDFEPENTDSQNQPDDEPQIPDYLRD